MIPVQELFQAEEQHRNRNKVPRNGCSDMPYARLLGETRCQRQRATAERCLPHHVGQGKPAMRMTYPSRGVHQRDKKEEGQCEQTCRQPSLNAAHQAEGCSEKARAYEVNPEQMPGNPWRHNRCHSRRQREMFGAEGRERRRVKKRPKQDQLFESSRSLPIAAEK